MKSSIAAALAVTAALFSAPLAQATPAQDDELSSREEAAGIPVASNDPQLARNVCTMFYGGWSPLKIAHEMDLQNEILDLSQSISFVAIAISIYCSPPGEMLA